jgi:predicted hotdog family 3-hydroxylacyl-ACP dehydratase
MSTQQAIAGLIPHRGAMCLLDCVESWSAEAIVCRARSHLDPANPLRSNGRLGALAGIEYGLQAAAAHGALRDGAPQPPGYLAGLRSVRLHRSRLDEPALGVLGVHAMLRFRDTNGLIYDFDVCSETGEELVSGRATIILLA